ncbi:MAG: ABC-type transport auxiliary lipoprotein family protein [Candidatus Latescibacterota bacterium]|nr:ABC-type transport auxiliary lipoprotein family protein [Candidatus Latescibacterota bacterium]
MRTPLRRSGAAWIALALCACLLASACTQLLGGRTEIRQRRKFMIGAVPLRVSPTLSERPYELKVQIDRLEVSRLYDRNQLVYRLAPEEIRDDEYNTWAIRPSEMVTDAVTTYLKEASLFTDIRQEFLDSAPDLTLTGTLNAIERLDSGDRWFARLDITLQLVDRQNKIFWQMDFAPNEQEVYDPDLVFSVQAMKELLRENMRRAIIEIDRRLLIRKIQNDPGRDLAAVLEAGNGKFATAEAVTEATEEIPRETSDYYIIRGKLVPED